MDRRILLILAALVVALSSAGAGTILLRKHLSPTNGRAPAVEVKPGAVTYAKLPAMSFTLNDGTRLRELQLRVVLELDPSVPAKAVEPYIPHITDAISLRMSDVDPEELRGADGPLYVKDALRYSATKVLRPLKVRQVLVQDMLLR